MMDLATDINVILVYFGEEGQEGYGWMMLGMVLASMGLQLVLVLLQFSYSFIIFSSVQSTKS